MNSKKRTTVRLLLSNAAWWGRICRALASLSSQWAARVAVWRYLRPPARRRPRMREQLVLAAGQRLEVGFQSTTLSVWRWGRGPIVLLAHDWGGSAGQLQSFVQPLVRAGFTVVAFDAPGHGVSGGTWTSLSRLAQALTHVAETVGPLHAIVAHAFGAAAATLAISRGLRVGRLVQIGPPADAAEWFSKYTRALRLRDDVEREARHRLEQRLGLGLDSLTAERLAGAVEVPVLVIHDRLDDRVPWDDGARIARALPRGRLMTTLGLGHTRIVEEPAVIAATQRFLERDRPPVVHSGPMFGALSVEPLGVPA